MTSKHVAAALAASFAVAANAASLGYPQTPRKPVTDVNDPAFQKWLKETATLPAEKQLEAVSKKLIELNPGFDGKMTGVEQAPAPKVAGGIVTGHRVVPWTVVT